MSCQKTQEWLWYRIHFHHHRASLRERVVPFTDSIIAIHGICICMDFVLSIPDPVHKYVRLTELEATLISLPQFQRLKRIKQLGVAAVVFPGALHTRFEHSLGTMEVAHLMFERLNGGFDEMDCQKVRLAALLHDIGHSAFSHTVELGLRRLDDIAPPRHREHEAYTRDIIEAFGEHKVVKEALNNAGVTEDARSFFRRVGAIATGEKEMLDEHDRFLSSIVSGEIDADRIDYLLRDGLHTGMHFIGFDLQHLLEYVVRNGERVGLGRAGASRSFDELVSINIGEAFLIARYHYYTTIVNHPDNVAANTMLMEALEQSLRKFSESSSKGEMQRELDRFFTAYDDNDVLDFIRKNGGDDAEKVLNALREGRIFHCLADLRSRALSPEMRLYIELLNKKPSLINGVEREVRSLMGTDRMWIRTSAVRGVPKYLEVKVGNGFRFLYDESKLAASLVMEILSSNSLYFYGEHAVPHAIFKEKWHDITAILEGTMAKEREGTGFQLERLLLLFHELLNVAGGFQKSVRYITRVYRMVKRVQERYPGSFHYVFDEHFRIVYAPELFIDIMKLGAMGLLHIMVEEKSRELADYGIENGCSDYPDRRNHIYYRFAMTSEGKRYCEHIAPSYEEYVEFLSAHMPEIYGEVYSGQNQK
ncbi:MAG TPA: HD domain-containing protein [Thermoplasmatales archaeon]|nr:HD domain-containing protein [Thermoplasmatales archaeon]